MLTDSFPAKIFVFAVCKFTQPELLSFSLKSLSFTHSCNGIMRSPKGRPFISLVFICLYIIENYEASF